MCNKLLINIALQLMLITKIQFTKLFVPTHKHVEPNSYGSWLFQTYLKGIKH